MGNSKCNYLSVETCKTIQTKFKLKVLEPLCNAYYWNTYLVTNTVLPEYRIQSFGADSGFEETCKIRNHGYETAVLIPDCLKLVTHLYYDESFKDKIEPFISICLTKHKVKLLNESMCKEVLENLFGN